MRKAIVQRNPMVKRGFSCERQWPKLSELFNDVLYLSLHKCTKSTFKGNTAKLFSIYQTTTVIKRVLFSIYHKATLFKILLFSIYHKTTIFKIVLFSIIQTRKVRTWHASFLSHLELGQKLQN